MAIEATDRFPEVMVDSKHYNLQPIYQTRPHDEHQSSDYGDNLMDLDAWEAENPHSPKRRLISVTAAKSDPIHAVRFHDACQALGVVAVFDIQETSPYAFSGAVQFAGTKVETDGPAASKKLVKEALCKQALPVLQSLSDGLKTRKASVVEETQRQILHSPLNAENWIGTLQNYTQKARIAKPQYDELMTDRTPFEYACTVHVEGGELTTFGSTEKLYPTKAEARKAAAREAIIYLRSQGKAESAAPVDPGMAVKRQKLDHKVAQASPGHTGLTQTLSEVDVNAASESLPNQVHAVVASLGFQQPSFEAHVCPPPPSVSRNESLAGFVNMAAYFREADVQSEPRLNGGQGRVNQVYGRKKAKDLCCRELLRVLEDIKRSRGL